MDLKQNKALTENKKTKTTLNLPSSSKGTGNERRLPEDCGLVFVYRKDNSSTSRKLKTQ